MIKKKNVIKIELELRPHHVLAMIGHETQPELYSISDKQYIKLFREDKKKTAIESAKKQGKSKKEIEKAGEISYNFHSDKLIIHWRNTIKKIHDNPNIKFKYIKGIDSVCLKCMHKKNCSDKTHWSYKLVKKADDEAMKLLPKLKINKIYDGNFIFNNIS